jgi:hypothetical protein
MMKKLICSVLVVIASLFAGYSYTYAKDANLEIEFSFDPEFEIDIVGYKLYYIKVPGSAVRVFITDINNVQTRVFDTPTFDLSPGKLIDFYMSAVSTDGGEAFSPAFPFKYTGKPFVISVRSKK